MGSPDRQQLKSNKRPLSRGSTISSVLESYTVPHETFNGVLAEQSLRQPPQLESPSSASPNPTKPRSRWPLKNVFNRPKRHKKEHSGAVDTISSSPQDAETHSTSKFVSLQDLVYLLNQVHCQVWKCLKNHEAQATGHEASKTERGSDRLQAQLKQWAQIHVRLWNVIYKIWTEKFNQDNLPMNTPTSKRGLLENLKLLESKTCVPSLHLGHAKGVEFPQTPQIVKDCDTFLRSPEWSKFLVFMEFVDNMPSGFSEQALVNIAVTLVCGEADSTQETISQEPSFHPEQHTREAKAINVVCRFFGPRLPECLREIIRPWSKLPSAEYLLSSTFNNSPPPMEVSVFFGDNPYAKPTELLIETTVAAIVKNSPDTYWRVPKNMVRMRSLVSELHVLDIAAVFGLSNVVARLLSLRDVAHLQDTHPLQEITRSLYFAMVGPVIFCFGENHLEAMETVKPGSFFDGVNSIETVRKLVVRQKRIIGLLNDNRLADESDNQLTKANGHNSQRKQKTQSDQKDALRAAGDVPAMFSHLPGNHFRWTKTDWAHTAWTFCLRRELSGTPALMEVFRPYLEEPEILTWIQTLSSIPPETEASGSGATDNPSVLWKTKEAADIIERFIFGCLEDLAQFQDPEMYHKTGFVWALLKALDIDPSEWRNIPRSIELSDLDYTACVTSIGQCGDPLGVPYQPPESHPLLKEVYKTHLLIGTALFSVLAKDPRFEVIERKVGDLPFLSHVLMSTPENLEIIKLVLGEFRSKNVDCMDICFDTIDTCPLALCQSKEAFLELSESTDKLHAQDANKQNILHAFAQRKLHDKYWKWAEVGRPLVPLFTARDSNDQTPLDIALLDIRNGLVSYLPEADNRRILPRLAVQLLTLAQQVASKLVDVARDLDVDGMVNKARPISHIIVDWGSTELYDAVNRLVDTVLDRQSTTNVVYEYPRNGRPLDINFCDPDGIYPSALFRLHPGVQPRLTSAVINKVCSSDNWRVYDDNGNSVLDVFWNNIKPVNGEISNHPSFYPTFSSDGLYIPTLAMVSNMIADRVYVPEQAKDTDDSESLPSELQSLRGEDDLQILVAKSDNTTIHTDRYLNGKAIVWRIFLDRILKAYDTFCLVGLVKMVEEYTKFCVNEGFISAYERAPDHIVPNYPGVPLPPPSADLPLPVNTPLGKQRIMYHGPAVRCALGPDLPILNRIHRATQKMPTALTRIVQVLLPATSRPDIVWSSIEAYRTLSFCVRNNVTTTVKSLLSIQVPVYNPDFSRRKNGDIPPLFSACLVQAQSEASPTVFKNLLSTVKADEFDGLFGEHGLLQYLYEKDMLGQKEKLAIYLEAGGSPNMWPTHSYAPPLLSLALRHQSQIVCMLIKAGADPTVTHHENVIFLVHIIARFGLLDVAMALVQVMFPDTDTTEAENYMKAVANSEQVDGITRRKEEVISDPISALSKTRDMSQVRSAIKPFTWIPKFTWDAHCDSNFIFAPSGSNEDAPDSILLQQCTPMHFAAFHGQLSMINFFAAFTDMDVNATTVVTNYTPAHMAAMNMDAPTLKALMDNGADLTIKDYRGRNCLHLACTYSDMVVVGLLLDCDKIEIDAKDIDGSTPYQLAITRGEQRIAAAVLEKMRERGVTNWAGPLTQATINSLEDAIDKKSLELFKKIVEPLEEEVFRTFAPCGCSLVIMTARAAFWAALDFLINDDNSGYKGDCTTHGSTKQYDLLITVVEQKVPSATLEKVLSSYRAKDVAWDTEDYTALHAVAKTPHFENLNILLADLRPPISSGSLEGAEGGDFYMALVDPEFADFVQPSSTSNVRLKTAINKEAPGHPLPNRPLHIAAAAGQYFIAAKLVNSGADVSVVDSDGMAPLHYAAVSGSVETVANILQAPEQSVDVDPRNNNGESPLFLGIKHPNMWEELSSRPVDFDVTNFAGENLGHIIAKTSKPWSLIRPDMSKQAWWWNKDDAGRIPLMMMLAADDVPDTWDEILEIFSQWQHVYTWVDVGFEDQVSLTSIIQGNKAKMIISAILSAIPSHELERIASIPLHLAVRIRNYSLVEYLARGGISMDIPSATSAHYTQRAPLAYALERRDHAMVKKLVELGASLSGEGVDSLLWGYKIKFPALWAEVEREISNRGD